MSDQFSSIDAAIRAFREGKIVIVVDAEDRENEGDFICAAEDATPDAINFMITHGRGQVCMSVLPDVAQRLELPR
ncbi:MAG TPA: bifunctional 3,4-dihydroxy-2-butanone-4-phosphate synthase/GTP cyclohydrolase II, partial [Planctomycetaceae bacterium]|nr:bifunctional 3,4-dihydroxy-2-butanone-4-phosphate synthase/GTP cyclohydrolase II [Planctomycetaceae bacterium]